MRLCDLGIYVFDFDDVLVDFSKLLYKNIRENWRLFKKYFWNPGEVSNEVIQSRNTYYMNEWLIHKKYTELTSNQYSALSIEIWAKIVSLFFTKEDIYGEAEPTEFAKRTLMNPLFIDDKSVKEVIILSRNITEVQENSKKAFIEKYFNHPKIRYVGVMGNETKSEALRKNEINFNVIVDDELKNIRDIAEAFKDNLTEREFIIPKFGYNENMPKELKFLIEAKGGSITYYDHFKK